MYAERLVVSAGVDPLRSVRCPRCTPAAIVVGGVQEGRAYERNRLKRSRRKTDGLGNRTLKTEARFLHAQNAHPRTCSRCYEATNELADRPIASVFSAPKRVNRRADDPLQMTNEILSDTKVIFTHGNAVIPFGHLGYIRLCTQRAF